jgi:Tfp pilus assembly protein PilF
LLRERGDAVEAVKQLEEAVKQAPRYVLALSNLAISYSMAERHQEAESAIRKAVVLSPDDGLLRANLATVLHRMGKADEARQQMDLARKLNPRLGGATNP